MKSVKEIEKEIVNEFSRLPDVDTKYTHLFQLGNQLSAMDPSLKNEQNKVEGCHSDLWFHLSSSEEKYYLSADSDSMVIKGVAALLVRIVDGRIAAEIQEINLDFLDEIGIWKLPSERNNGLLAMLTHLKSQVRMIDQGIEDNGEVYS